MKVLLFLALLLGASYALYRPLALRSEIIDFVNNHPDATWKAGRNPRFEGLTVEDAAKLCGVKPGAPKLPEKDFSSYKYQLGAIPDNFDAREQWGNICPSVKEIRDQGACGSCWAFGSAEAITDRTCIAHQGAWIIDLSAGDLVSCSSAGGCDGGWPSSAWSYWKQTGLVTGGLYNDNRTCFPYYFEPCTHHGFPGTLPACKDYQPTPACPSKCVNGATWAGDKHKGSSTYSVSGVSNIQLEIMNHGPVTADFTVYEDFLSYRSGIYQHTTGSSLGGHAIKIVGWGIENNIPYWIIANSWNTEFGEGGYFRMLRGKNSCGIEGDVVAGIPL